MEWICNQLRPQGGLEIPTVKALCIGPLLFKCKVLLLFLVTEVSSQEILGS